MQQVKARGNVENWLCLVEESMVVSLRRLTKSSIGDFESKLRHEWATQHPSQVSIMMCLFAYMSVYCIRLLVDKNKQTSK